jgi:hypothetical protein
MLAAVAALAGLAMAGCSSSSKDSSSSGSATTVAPEDLRASAAEVGAGLKHLQAIAVDVATAGNDKAKAKSLTDQIEPVWKKVEGTVKANDKDAYVSFEDNFALLEKSANSGDAAKAEQAATGVSKAVAAYLSKFPG